jgi:signal transduction histidine kinase
MIENLAQNAVKYGRSKTDISIEISVDPDLDRVSLSVHNVGNPIPPEERQHLFDRFHRAPSAIVGGQKGWGLGLLLVRGIADALGGKVSVESSPEKGTTFEVFLPRDSRQFQPRQSDEPVFKERSQ